MGRMSDMMIEIETRLFEGQQPAEIAAGLGLSVEQVEDSIGLIEDTYEDDGQPSEYEEWQDVYGGDDAFETCNFCEDY
jgi:hypothetical protein